MLRSDPVFEVTLMVCELAEEIMTTEPPREVTARVMSPILSVDPVLRVSIGIDDSVQPFGY